ncbi:hypothetical protein QQS21_002856 [Conoideocrella luteorostrata]|uniref:2-oxoadipate dioxygenase/decarboxylase n=1 Tax=Conoideocrella luteorostrata TaxID=1105319 RepID=A0AAJ0FW56_9HYPO|nr:hypothetical protein QQS21_002856 [Conoideocrella luteorostrata]
MSSSKTITTTLHEDLADPNALRTSFILAMSNMYKSEVPLYGTLVDIVSDVNKATLQSSLDPNILSMRYGDAVGPSSRIDIERHGAIRLGTPHELRTIRRIFNIIGLHPVGYYDLAPAGLPMHATCFRPKSKSSLRQNPFRVFTSVLRPELIKDAQARSLAMELLSKRNIFTPQLMDLLDEADIQSGRLTLSQSKVFISEAMETFKWHGTAASSHQDYMCLKAEHPILADIACFRSAHINHLTPRTVDIIAAQNAMEQEGLSVKERIEGPPSRKCPILLRQTSFLAIEEPIKFATTEPAAALSLIQGSHRARFGEIEERGAAVTPAGRALYDTLLDEAMAAAKTAESISAESLDDEVAKAFSKYPDTWEDMRSRDLVYFSYRVKQHQPSVCRGAYTMAQLLTDGVVEVIPITYEDFLPLSAAGIFQSNLGNKDAQQLDASPDVAGLEQALGVKLSDSDELYRSIRDESIQECARLLGITIEL